MYWQQVWGVIGGGTFSIDHMTLTGMAKITGHATPQAEAVYIIEVIFTSLIAGTDANGSGIQVNCLIYLFTLVFPETKSMIL